MTLAEFGIIADMVGAIAVMVTLGYLALQIVQANRMAHAKTRERMVEHGTGELYVLMNDPPNMPRTSRVPRKTS
jgi:hypothetical protein